MNSYQKLYYLACDLLFKKPQAQWQNLRISLNNKRKNTLIYSWGCFYYDDKYIEITTRKRISLYKSELARTVNKRLTININNTADT